ncbi:unnamed protein product [Sphagnum jensenii]|uniref:NADP-dependent oxidoreductase domain-containing protein n=1 Tax=Sphagnum jensenii TaxID=128206 RepID=A0ABP0VCM0_9BRYO
MTQSERNLLGHGSLDEGDSISGELKNATLPVVLLHSPYCWSGHCTAAEQTVSWREGWRNLEEYHRQGKAKTIGVSNFDLGLFTELLSITTAPVGVVQDREVRLLAAKTFAVYMAYSSLGTQWEHKLGHNPVFASETLQRIAHLRGLSVAQVVTSWLLQSGVVAIPRSADPAHIRELGIFITEQSAGNEKKEGVRVYLEEEDMRAIEALDGTLGEF